jgi:hypothetical protein
VADLLESLARDVLDLKRWAAQHDEEHTADTRLLASIMDAVREHTHNAHGIRSRATQVGYTGLIVAIASAIIEILRRFVL